MVISLWNFAATLTISAAGRACRPFLFTIWTSRSGISGSPRRGRTAASRTMRDRHPSTRPWRLASSTAPDSTPISVAGRAATCPGPMIAVERERKRNAGQRAPPRDRSAAGRAAAPDCRATGRRRARGASRRCRPQTRRPRWPGVVQAEERQHRRPAASRPGRTPPAPRASRTAATPPTRAGRRRCRADRRAPCGNARCAPGPRHRARRARARRPPRSRGTDAR